MLDKVSIGALVALVVMVLGFFGINIPEEISSQIVAVVAGIIAIFTYFTTAFLVKERKKNTDKLVLR